MAKKKTMDGKTKETNWGRKVQITFKNKLRKYKTFLRHAEKMVSKCDLKTNPEILLKKSGWEKKINVFKKLLKDTEAKFDLRSSVKNRSEEKMKRQKAQ